MTPEERFRRLRDASRWDGPVPRTSMPPSTAAATTTGAAGRRSAWRVAVVTATMVAVVAAVSVAAITLRPGAAGPAGPGGSPEPAPPSPTETVAPVPSSSASVSPRPAASSTTTTTTPPPAAPTACAPGGVVATAEPLDGSAGSAYLLVTLRNASTEPCTVGGYPTIRFLTGADLRAAGLVAAREPWTQGTAGTGAVRLAPKLGTAFVLVRISDAGAFDPKQCLPVDATAVALRLGATSDTITVPLPAPVRACSGGGQQLFASQLLAKRPVG